MPNVNKVIVNGQVKIDLTSDTVSPDKILEGFTAHDKTGTKITGTCDYDANTSDANALAAEILANKSAYVMGSKVTGTMPNNESFEGELNTVDPCNIPRGFHDGGGHIGISQVERAKLIPENIRDGVSILGIEGTMSGTEGAKAQNKTVTPSFASQQINPDADRGYNYLSSVTIDPIPVSETDNAQGGLTVTVG